MNILVTGGAGFIGSHFIKYWLSAFPNDRVICFDLLTYAGNLSTLKSVMHDPHFRFVRGDVCDKKAVEQVMREELPDYVVNFAAESHVDRSIDAADLFLRTNILGTAVLMDACLKYRVKRFHQVSTDEVYGDLPLHESALPFTELSLLRPSSPYSSSKASADLLVSSYVRTYGLNATVSRCSNNYGPYQFPEKLIPRMITNLLLGKPLPVYGTGENVRDWIWVEDHCSAIVKILFEGKTGEIYNVGASHELSNLSLVRMICEKLGADESVITFIPDRKGHDLRYAIDSSKLISELGWRPDTDFGSGLSSTVDWYMKNRDWWEPLLDI